MDPYFLWDKGEKMYFHLPTSWKVINNVVPDSERISKSVYQMVSESIANPIGTLPLDKTIKPKDKVVIIIDDFARPTPKKEMLTCLIDHLKGFGVKDNQIDILFGVGTHRPLSEQEVEAAMGKELLKKIRYTIHDCHSEKLVSVGRLKTGGDIKVNSLLREVDFRMSIGSIIPHLSNGFGGGAKIILPGVSGYETIREHHLACVLNKGAFIGNIKNNLFYEESCEAARLADLNFIVNTIYNSRGEVKGVVSGDFKKAHQFGVDLSLKEFSVNIDQQADVSIISAYPHGEGPQIMKPLDPAAMVTKKGGTVILVASIQGGLPEAFLKTFDIAYQMAKGDPKKLVMKYLQERKLIIENGPLDMNAALDFTLLYLALVNVIMVSRDVTKDQMARVGFGHADSLDQAIQKVHEKVPQAKVNIFAAGGLTVPVLKRDLAFDWKNQ